MAARKQIPYSESDLFAPGEQLSYTGDALKEIAFPSEELAPGPCPSEVGPAQGLEIFNRPGKGKGLAYTLPAIYTRTASGKSMARLLEAKLQPSFSYGNGMPPTEACGLPRLADAVFKGEYPFAHIEFKEPKLPVKVELTAFNPMIPLNEKDSAIPAAILRYKITNTSKEKVEATICWSLQNACGNDGQIGGIRHHALYGLQKNDFIDEKAFAASDDAVQIRQGRHPLRSRRLLRPIRSSPKSRPGRARAGGRLPEVLDEFSSSGKLTDSGIDEVTEIECRTSEALGCVFRSRRESPQRRRL